jgi:hypothetical protein
VWVLLGGEDIVVRTVLWLFTLLLRFGVGRLIRPPISWAMSVVSTSGTVISRVLLRVLLY